MSDKPKNFAVPATKSVRNARFSIVASSSKTRIPKSNNPTTNTTLMGDGNTTMTKQGSMPDFDSVQRQITYGKLLRAMLEDCLVDEKMEKEERQIDNQLALLADRVQKTNYEIDMTNRRLKDIKFVVEQKRYVIWLIKFLFSQMVQKGVL